MFDYKIRSQSTTEDNLRLGTEHQEVNSGAFATSRMISKVASQIGNEPEPEEGKTFEKRNLF